MSSIQPEEIKLSNEEKIAFQFFAKRVYIPFINIYLDDYSLDNTGQLKRLGLEVEYAKYQTVRKSFKRNENNSVTWHTHFTAMESELDSLCSGINTTACLTRFVELALFCQANPPSNISVRNVIRRALKNHAKNIYTKAQNTIKKSPKFRDKNIVIVTELEFLELTKIGESLYDLLPSLDYLIETTTQQHEKMLK